MLMENKLNAQAIICVHSTEWFNSFPVFKKNQAKVLAVKHQSFITKITFLKYIASHEFFT